MITNEPVMHAVGDGQFMFWCPACECAHGINRGWTFDGDMVTPTISPSLLSRGEKQCHIFIRAGRIEYLGDCDHALAGTTVDMVPWRWP